MATKLTAHWWFWPSVSGLALIVLLWLGPHITGVLPVYLWTDRMIFLLVVMSFFLTGYIRHREHLRGPWSRVLRSRLTMVAAVILIAYVVVGLLDSVHFRMPLPSQGSDVVAYSPNVQSLFDVALGPLATQVEKTYSAPFAAYLYSKETVDTESGRQRVFPRLRYGGAHLQDPQQQRGPDIALRTLRAAVEATVAWFIFSGIAAAFWGRRSGQPALNAWRLLMRGHAALPWHAALYTLLAMLFLVFCIIRLGPYYHILGTDKVGVDVLYQAIKSIRTGLVIGTLTTLVMLPFAILLGIAAGYFRGWVDDVIQYFYTTLSSIPGVLLISAAILSIQLVINNHPEWFETSAHRADLRLLALCIILGITSWTSLCRLLRGETLKLNRMDYIEAATAFGVRHFTIIGRHILPNVMHIILIVVVLDFSGLVLAEAVLSYVGVGVDPSTISWGNMINSARLEMAREPVVWWTLFAAFIFMFTLVLAANVFSDAVRDAFDPRLRDNP